MMHIVARTVRGRLLFESWAEGVEVWEAILRAIPQPQALCLMPDHVHLLHGQDVRARLGRALGGVARRRNHREGRRGTLFHRLSEAIPVVGKKKQQRSVRYVHLNPCRAGLVRDPLGWPLSTHRDAVGLTWPTVGPRRTGHHRYVSADPTSHVAGTLLPVGAMSADPHDVAAAVSAVLRLPIDLLGRDAHARSLVWDACCELAPVGGGALSDILGVHKRTLVRRVPVDRQALARVRMVVGDDRFGPLDGYPLRRTLSWSRYRV